MGLRAKFNLVLLLGFVIGLGLAAAVSWEILQENARREVLQEATIMMAEAHAVADYTGNQIDPLLVGQDPKLFSPQSVPFFAAQANLKALSEQFPDYSFKEAALNPTNPTDKAADWQIGIIDEFRLHPTESEFTLTRDTPQGEVLTLSRPVRVTGQDCLTCHSTPEAAPSGMVKIYGTKNGFGWHLGDVQGIEVVSVPMRVAQERALRSFVTFIGALAAVFAITVLLLNVLLQTVIIRPIRKMSAIATTISLGDEAPEFETRGHDEIAALGQAFNRMRRSLANAMKILEG